MLFAIYSSRDHLPPAYFFKKKHFHFPPSLTTQELLTILFLQLPSA